jgi:hypothetical protein
MNFSKSAGKTIVRTGGSGGGGLSPETFYRPTRQVNAMVRR